VPIGRPVDRFRGLADRLLAGGRDDDAEFVGRVVVLLQVVDALEAVGVLLGRETGEVVEAGLVLQRLEHVLDRVGAHDDALGVTVGLTVEDVVAQQLLDGVCVHALRLRDWRVGFGVRAHGESAQL